MQQPLLTSALRVAASLQLGLRTFATKASGLAAAVDHNSSKNLSTSSSTNNILPYYVGRSASKNLSVYHRVKSGGTNITTEVKKVEGDASTLAEHLQDELGVEAIFHPKTKVVIIRGRHKDRVVDWLVQKGF